jgi:hypothetical protein
MGYATCAQAILNLCVWLPSLDRTAVLVSHAHAANANALAQHWATDPTAGSRSQCRSPSAAAEQAIDKSAEPHHAA